MCSLNGALEMEFRVLGPMEVLRCGQRIEISGARQRCVLAALLAHANQVVSSEWLIDELWGEQPPPTAATALQMHVSRLRKALQDSGEGSSEVIVTRRPGYLIRVEPERVDALRFESLLGRGRAALAAGDHEAAGDDLRAALRLWRGPALAEFADHAFAQAWSARLQLLRLAAAQDRIEADLALGRHEKLVEELYELVRAEPLRERFWAQLMTALYRCGRQADALRAFGELRRTLAESLGIDPSPDLRSLEEKILLQDPEMDWKRPSGNDGRTVLSRPTPDVPVVGRERELGVLVRRLDEASGGRGSLVLIRGEPGIGKTRLAEELAAIATARGALVLWGQSFEDGGGGSYSSWSQALSTWLGTVEPSVVARTAGPQYWHLGRLLPELAPEQPMESPPADVETDGTRLQLFDAVCALLRGLSRTHSVVVVVLDDLQWADIGSLLLLQHLSRELVRSPLLVLVTYRHSELSRGHPLTSTLGELARHRTTERLNLAGLTAADVAQMIEWRTGLAPGPLAEAIHRRTEGNPFFVSEILSLLQAEDRLGDSAGGDVPVPEGVRAVIERRCSRLSAAAHRLLRVAAVAGREFQADVIEQLWDSPEEVLDLLDEVEASGLVAADPDAVGRYLFSHDIVRESVYEALSPLRRARLHGQIGQVLAGGGRARDAASSAYHLLLGISGGVDRSLAAQQAVAAANAATTSLAYEAAVDWYEHALTALAPEGGDVDVVHVLLALGDARWRAGDAARARETFLDAAERARVLDDPELLARAVLGFGGGLLRSWHATRGAFGDRPLRLLQEALERIGDHDNVLRPRLLGMLAEELYYLPCEQRRDELTLQALELARRSGDAATLASALGSRYLATWGPTNVQERLSLGREVLRLANELNDRQMLFFGHQCLFVANFELGFTDQAYASLDALEKLADELRQTLAYWEVRRFGAMKALFSGQLDEAERLALEALQIGQAAQEPDAMAVFGVQLAMIRFEQGRLIEMEPAMGAFVEEFPETPAWRAALALLQAELGREAEARERFEVLAREGFGSMPEDFAWMSGVVLLTQLCAFLGDTERAPTLTTLLSPFAGGNAMTADRQSWGATSRYLGLLAFIERRFGAARRWQERAIDENARMGSPPWVAYSKCELAETLLVAGDGSDRRRARGLAEEAATTARILGLARLLAAAERVVSWASGDSTRMPDPRPATMRPWLSDSSTP